MPKAILKSVYSFSSEDPAFPASNLLKNLKWRSQGVGQEAEHVTIQLEKPTVISGIDLGNEASCFLGVFVAKSGQEMTSDNYQELLLTSSFMTPVECRSLENINRVRCFNKASLVEDVANEKWDFVKIVCSQPFNAHTQYGLSFITIYSPEQEAKEEVRKVESSGSPSVLGRFVLREESPETDDRGSLFNKWKLSQESSDDQASTSVSVSPAVAIRKASAELLREKKEERPPPVTPKPPKVSQKAEKPRRNRIIHDSDDSDEEETASVAKKPKVNNEIKVATPQQACKAASPARRVAYQPFGRLLNEVIFTISGIQNPERATLRQKAMEMGARYKSDWDRSCTHLICAFKNTPKYNQVRGQGKIVQKNWILDCFARKTRFPWRRYALDRDDRNESESEDEVHDESRRPADQPQASSSRNRIEDSGSDTDDEIQRVLATKVPQKDIYDRTTEEEDEGKV
ncbi:DNA repair protein XRCC1 [Phlebotomus argentipes]|uniref:DNA repair protein XRCC1 n=1 Tax=Phlebotomus argentipes TaxID=94469 RepID=UPI0028936D49|nr:DNA repair protein XRCC1 [Phlebotomus argentipes]